MFNVQVGVTEVTNRVQPPPSYCWSQYTGTDSDGRCFTPLGSSGNICFSWWHVLGQPRVPYIPPASSLKVAEGPCQPQASAWPNNWQVPSASKLNPPQDWWPRQTQAQWKGRVTDEVYRGVTDEIIFPRVRENTSEEAGELDIRKESSIAFRKDMIRDEDLKRFSNLRVRRAKTTIA